MLACLSYYVCSDGDLRLLDSYLLELLLYPSDIDGIGCYVNNGIELGVLQLLHL
jgi:hypothetical protein